MTKRSNTALRLKTAVIIGIIGLSVLFTVYSDEISGYAFDAIKLCAVSVVPSLFPFMVLSGIASIAVTDLPVKDSRKTGIAVSAVLGALCGFPVGASSVVNVYKNGTLYKKEAEYLCAVCNNTGPAFVIGVIGCSFWKSYQLGVIFYICQLLSSAIVFILCRSIFGGYINSNRDNICNCITQAEEVRHLPTLQNAVYNVSKLFCNAVANSVIGVIKICGYVIFFKVLCDTLRMFMPESHTSELIYAMISAVLEFTTGAKLSAVIGGYVGIFLCGFTIGFSGLSVIAQSIDILSSTELSPIPMIVLKAVIGIISGASSVIAYKLFPVSDTVPVAQIFYETSIMTYISAAIIIVSVVFFTARKIKDLR